LKESDSQAPVAGEPSPLGLACTLSGLSLAGAPLLHRTEKGFDVRPGDQVAELLKCAYGEGINLGGLMEKLHLAGSALNRGDLKGAKAATALLNLAELDWARAVSLAQVEYQLKNTISRSCGTVAVDGRPLARTQRFRQSQSRSIPYLTSKLDH